MMSANRDVTIAKSRNNNTPYIEKYALYYLLTLIFLFLMPEGVFAQKKQQTQAYPIVMQSSLSKHSLFIPKRKANKGQWSAEVPNPSNRIILSAGHVNRISGTTGYNNAPLLDFKGAKHTTEAALTKVLVPFMVEIGLARGFDVEQFIADSDNFREASLELAHYENITNGIAFEIHTDSPSEGSHRAKGYDGHTGVIPPTNQTITSVEACIGGLMGKFKKGMRDLFVPKQGVSLVELFPTNKAITLAIHKAVKTEDYTEVKKIAFPYINLFFDSLERCGIAKAEGAEEK